MLSSSKSDLAKLLGSSDKHGKMLDSLVRDSKSDASTMSGLSTNLQSMKVFLKLIFLKVYLYTRINPTSVQLDEDYQSILYGTWS